MRPITWLASTRPGFERRWRRACEEAGLEPRAVSPGRLEAQLAPDSAAILDGDTCWEGDEDELLAGVGLARASGMTVAVVFGDPSRPHRLAGAGPSPAALGHDTHDLLDDLTGRLVVSEPVDGNRLCGAVARRLDRRRRERFELVTTTPDGDGLLAIWGDGQAARRPRPLSPDDPGGEVLDIRLIDDGRTAELVLAGDRVLRWSATGLRPDAEDQAPLPLDPQVLGERLRALRKAAGITQAELARRTGIHRPNIARLESGRHTPSLETLARITAAMGADPRTLLTG